LLQSLLEEVLRLRSTNASGRMVVRDTMLNNQFFLRANSTVLRPSVAAHNDVATWGAEAKQFRPDRFLKTREGGQPRYPAYAYRAFGGGAALCPGRFLASMEILSLLSVIILRFDITPVDSAGRATQWCEPKSRTHILTSILSPAKGVRVLIVEREKYQGVTWRYTLDDETVS
jgi:cytochrome P450